MKKNDTAKKNVITSKDKILMAATEIFAEKGYEAAGVDEIAKRAGVTKPLIYYYFEGKKEILEEIVRSVVKKNASDKAQYLNGMESLSLKSLYESMDARAEIFQKNGKVFKVIAMELLKEKPVCEPIFELIAPMVDTGLARFKAMGLEIEDDLELIMTSFFFGTAPLLAYMLFRDMFSEFYDIEKDTLDEKFYSAVKAIYIDYFAERYGINND